MSGQIQEIAKIAEDGVVKIVREDGKCGSAFLVSRTSIVTADHVVGPYNEVRVQVDGELFEAKVSQRDSAHDFAILRVDGLPRHLHELTMGNSETLSLGEDLIIAGYPLGSDKLTIHKCSLSAKGIATDFPPGAFKELADECSLLQLDGTINEGFSGGPVIQVSSKQVCGFITSKYGLLKDYTCLRNDIENLLQSPLIKEIRALGGGGIVLGGIDWHKFAIFMIDSLNVLSRSLQFMNVGIGYSVTIETVSRYLTP